MSLSFRQVIAAIIDDLLAQVRGDPQFQRFGAGRSVDSQNRARQLFVDQMCALAGGPCVYIGRYMKSSHAGLGITETEWQTNMKYAATSLDRFNIPQKVPRAALTL